MLRSPNTHWNMKQAVNFTLLGSSTYLGETFFFFAMYVIIVSIFFMNWEIFRSYSGFVNVAMICVIIYIYRYKILCA